MAKRLYEFTLEGWFLGTYYKAGDWASFHPEQVENEGHRVVIAGSVATALDEPATSPARTKRAKS